MRILSYIFILILILFGLTFAALNMNAVTINYYFGESLLPLSLLLVIVFSFGCLLGMIFSVGLFLKAKLASYRLQQRLYLAEKEIENLRAIPLQDKV